MLAELVALTLTVLVGLSLAAGAPAALAQTSAPRIGVLSLYSSSAVAPWLQAFRQGLRDLGWVEGRNLGLEYRYADGRRDRLPDLAAELVRLKVDVIVTSVDADALAAKNATTQIPIVMATPTDPVAFGLVQSFARPGGNVTGLSQMLPELMGKRLGLLKEIVPGLSRVGVLWNPAERAGLLNWNELQRAAPAMGLQLQSLEARSLEDVDKRFEEAAKARLGAISITPEVLYTTNLKRLADLATAHRLPSVYHLREFADAGGLLAYGPDRFDLYRRAAAYVDKILKGMKPSELPVEQPTKFELVLNQRTAKALGMTIPPAVLVRADTVIE